MNTLYKNLRTCGWIMLMGISYSVQAFGGSSGCSIAGTASASADSVCYSDTVTLNLTGYTGSVLQWQSFDGSAWVNETGPGSTTDSYDVSLPATALFRALVTEIGCPTDTSNEVTITVGTIPVPTASPASRCGPGTVTLQGSGSGTLEWFTSSSGGTPIATGSNTTAFIPSTTTLYVSDNVLGGGGSASPLLITEADLGGNDDLEIQNVSPTPLDVTGWKVAISDDYADINAVNANVQILSGILQPGDLITWTDLAAGPNYWGSNMLWNPGAAPGFTGWAIIIDDQDVVRDFVIWNWPSASIQAMSIVVDGVTQTPGTLWVGDGIDASVVAATNSLSRNGTSDNNSLTDFVIPALSLNATNPGMNIPFTGFGCSSPRVPVEITITPSDAITIDATATALCLSGSATLTALSNNTNYNYTWSPATGLNTTTGATVTSTPPATITYIVIGDDGNCSNVDSITISVGAPTVAGTAGTFQDTVCLGKDTDLILSGSTGDIQWQSLSGGVWINETGFGSDSAVYTVAPIVNTTYRAFVSSGSCPPDSSNSQEIIVITTNDPVTTDTTICGTGQVTLFASGQGLLSWFNDPLTGSVVNTGTSYAFNATQTDTFYVESFAGTSYNIGPATAAIGNQTPSNPNNTGMVFDVLRQVNIDVVHIYPNQTGTVTVNLRQTLGGTILATYTQNVTAFSGKTALPINFDVPVGTGYRLELESGSVSCQQNSAGAAYPYTVPNGPLSIVGYCNPNFASGVIYLYLYDWIVSEGCRSARIPSIVTVNAIPPVPTISQNWNWLTSSSPVGNQWYLNGVAIPGATDQIYTATQVGDYTVEVTINGCTSVSAIFPVLVIGMNEISSENISVYPVPANDVIYINSGGSAQNLKAIKIFDVAGRMIYQSTTHPVAPDTVLQIPVKHFEEGVYFIELTGSDNFARKRFIIAH